MSLDTVHSQMTNGFEIELFPNVSTFVLKDIGGKDVGAADDVQVLMEGLQEIKFVLERTQRRVSSNSAPRQREIFRTDAKRGRSK